MSDVSMEAGKKYNFPNWEMMPEDEILRYFADREDDPELLLAAMEQSSRVKGIMWERIQDDGDCISCGS